MTFDPIPDPQIEAPPTAAPPPAPPPPPAWPAALGAIAIVFGSFGVLGALFGIVIAFFQDAWLGSFAGFMPEEAAAEMAASAPHPAINGALQVAGLVVAALLFVAGIRLTRRRQSGARLLRLWAMLKIPLVLIGTVIGVRMSMGQSQAMAAAGAGGPPPGFQTSMMVMGLVVGLAWGWALPAFSLIWLSRAKVKAEVNRWPL